MPVTAKLSRGFYEKLGDAATNELVDWLNAVDGDYRSQLRDLNDLNFARFDAKVGQRFAESDANMERRFAEMEVSVAQRFADMDAKMDRRFAEMEVSVAQRFADMDAKMDRRFAEMEVSVAQRFADMDAKMDRGFSALEVHLANFESRMMRWMFVFWTGTAVSMLGVAYVALRR